MIKQHLKLLNELKASAQTNNLAGLKTAAARQWDFFGARGPVKELSDGSYGFADEDPGRLRGDGSRDFSNKGLEDPYGINKPRPGIGSMTDSILKAFGLLNKGKNPRDGLRPGWGPGFNPPKLPRTPGWGPGSKLPKFPGRGRYYDERYHTSTPSYFNPDFVGPEHRMLTGKYSSATNSAMYNPDGTFATSNVNVGPFMNFRGARRGSFNRMGLRQRPQGQPQNYRPDSTPQPAVSGINPLPFMNLGQARQQSLKRLGSRPSPLRQRPQGQPQNYRPDSTPQPAVSGINPLKTSNHKADVKQLYKLAGAYGWINPTDSQLLNYGAYGGGGALVGGGIGALLNSLKNKNIMQGALLGAGVGGGLGLGFKGYTDYNTQTLRATMQQAKGRKDKEAKRVEAIIAALPRLSSLFAMDKVISDQIEIEKEKKG